MPAGLQVTLFPQGPQEGPGPLPAAGQRAPTQEPTAYSCPMPYLVALNCQPGWENLLQRNGRVIQTWALFGGPAPSRSQLQPPSAGQPW